MSFYIRKRDPPLTNIHLLYGTPFHNLSSQLSIQP